MFGYAASTATIGGLTIWINDFIEEYFGIDPITSVLIFGGITIFNGIVASVVGSFINDRRVTKLKEETGCNDDQIQALTVQ